MNKKNTIRTIIITVLIITVFTVVIISVYMILNKRFALPQETTENIQDIILGLKGNEREQTIKTEKYKEVYYNLIMAETSEDEKTDVFILQTVDVNTGKLLFITIPSDTRITMSNSLYVELQAETPAIPQIIQLENVTRQSSVEKSGIYTIKILGEFLGIEIEYYTILSDELLYQFFKQENGSIAVTKSIDDFLSLPVTKRKTMERFQSLYESDGFSSNMPLEELCKYIEFYEAISVSDIMIYAAEGKTMNDAFILDSVKVNQKIYQYMND